jgi:hypothetical protein
MLKAYSFLHLKACIEHDCPNEIETPAKRKIWFNFSKSEKGKLGEPGYKEALQALLPLGQ